MKVDDEPSKKMNMSMSSPLISSPLSKHKSTKIPTPGHLSPRKFGQRHYDKSSFEIGKSNFIDTKYLGKITQQDWTRVMENWMKHSSKFSNLDSSFSERVNLSVLQANPLLEQKSEHQSFFTANVKDLHYESGDDKFEDSHSIEDDGEDERRKLFGFLRKHGNRLSGFAMWCGHAIIGMIPPMFSANGLIGVVVSTVLTSIFMITMFVYFIYLQGVKYWLQEGIEMESYGNSSSTILHYFGPKNHSKILNKKFSEKNKVTYNPAYANGDYSPFDDDDEEFSKHDTIGTEKEWSLKTPVKVIMVYIVNRPMKFISGAILVLIYWAICPFVVIIYKLERTVQ